MKLVVEVGDDERERDELTTRLRHELLRLDVDAVERPSLGAAPAGTRAVDLAQIGTLLVTVGQTAAGITALIAAVRSWLAARGTGTVKMQIGQDVLEVTGQLSGEQQALVDAWVKAHETR